MINNEINQLQINEQTDLPEILGQNPFKGFLIQLMGNSVCVHEIVVEKMIWILHVWGRGFFSIEASTLYLTQFCYKERIKCRPCALLSVNTQLRSTAMETSARLWVKNIIVLVPATFFPFFFFTHLVHGVYWESKEEARGIACECNFTRKKTVGEKS